MISRKLARLHGSDPLLQMKPPSSASHAHPSSQALNVEPIERSVGAAPLGACMGTVLLLLLHERRLLHFEEGATLVKALSTW